jgi:hypothetical protein
MCFGGGNNWWLIDSIMSTQLLKVGLCLSLTKNKSHRIIRRPQGHKDK